VESGLVHIETRHLRDHLADSTRRPNAPIASTATSVETRSRPSHGADHRPQLRLEASSTRARDTHRTGVGTCGGACPSASKNCPSFAPLQRGVVRVCPSDATCGPLDSGFVHDRLRQDTDRTSRRSPNGAHTDGPSYRGNSDRRTMHADHRSCPTCRSTQLECGTRRD